MTSENEVEREFARLMGELVVARLTFGPESRQANEALRNIVVYSEAHGEALYGDAIRRAYIALRERGR
jgi:hypothetical protein